MPRDSMTRIGMPRWRAISRPPAEARLLMTMAISASSLRREMALAMASMLEPLPDIRMPSRILAILHAAFAASLLGDVADDPRVLSDSAAERSKGLIGLLRGYHEDHP